MTKNTEDFSDDEWAPYRDQGAIRTFEEREFDFRVKTFALDMAVQALPSLVTPADPEERKFVILRRAASEFEKLLRGEATA